jgi:hypothetical protein
MTYDLWKSTNPADREPRDPPCEESPHFEDGDICAWCGADPTQACKWDR